MMKFPQPQSPSQRAFRPNACKRKYYFMIVEELTITLFLFFVHYGIFNFLTMHT